MKTFIYFANIWNAESKGLSFINAILHNYALWKKKTLNVHYLEYV